MSAANRHKSELRVRVVVPAQGSDAVAPFLVDGSVAASQLQQLEFDVMEGKQQGSKQPRQWLVARDTVRL